MIILAARSSFSKRKTASMQTHGIFLMLVVVALFGAQLPKVQGCLSCQHQQHWNRVNDFLREALREVTANEAITLADANQDGKLSTQEAFNYLRPYYSRYSPERFSFENIQEYNNNGDGYLSAAEIEYARKQLAIKPREETGKKQA